MLKAVSFADWTSREGSGGASRARSEGGGLRAGQGARRR
jgi:hypothetical protein